MPPSGKSNGAVPAHAGIAAGDGRVGRLVAGGLAVLAGCLTSVVISTTLRALKSAPTEEGWLTTQVCYPHPYVLPLGALAGALACVCLGVLAARELARGALAWSGALLLGAAAAAAAAHELAWGAYTAARVVDIPVASHWRTRLSVAALALVGTIWAARCWWRLSRQAAEGELADAEATLAASMRQVTWRDLLASLPGMALTGVLICLAVCVPTAWLALSRAYDPGSGMLAPLALSASGAALFCVLHCLMLAGVLVLMIAVAGRRRAAGGGASCGIAAGMVAGAFAFLLSAWGLTLAVGDELKAFGLTPLAWVLLWIGAAFYGAAFSRNVLELLSAGRQEGRRPGDLGDLVRAFIVAGVAFPVLAAARWVRGRIPKADGPFGGPSVRLGWPAAVAAGAVIALLVAYLLPKLFPRNMDLFTRIRFFLVTLIVLLTVLLGALVTPRARRFWRARLAALGGIVAASVVGLICYNDAMSYARPRVFRHDEIGKHSLRVVEGLLPPMVQSAQGAQAWQPPNLPAAATIRRPVMDDLKRKRPLIILVILDACRKDRMSLYGYRRKEAPFLATTPNLDRHRDELVRFTTAFTPGTSTTCALRHLYTGRYSSRWMMQKEGIGPFWTNDLIRAGYHAFHLNILTNDYNGITTDAFLRDLPPDLRARVATLDCFDDAPGDKTAEHAQGNRRATPDVLAELKDKVKFIECNRQAERQEVQHLLHFLAPQKPTGGSGVFAYIHMDMTHSPWHRIPEVEDFGGGEPNRYDESVRFCDMILGELIAGLKALEMWDDAVLIVTADHGTIFVTGGYHPHHDRLDIPLIMKLPGVKGREVHEMVSLFDVGPTLMDVFWPRTLGQYEGRSLWPVIFGDQKWPGRVLFGLSAFADCYYLLHANGWHYVRNRGERFEQLFNWRTDPAGEHDLTGVDKEATWQTRQLMNWFLEDYGRGRDYTNPYHYRGPP